MLDVPRLTASLHAAGFTWELPDYSRVTTSTQDDARHLRAIGKRLPYCVVTDEQTAGRGRLTRTWTAPTGSALLLTIALPLPDDLAALPLSIGVTVLRVLQRTLPALQLKWPNDIVIVHNDELRKLGGLIVELDGDAALIGIGLNTAMQDDELPTEQAISFTQLGLAVDREAMLTDLLKAFDPWLRPTIDDYRDACSTIGNVVAVTLTNGDGMRGLAVGVSDTGALRVDVDGVVHEIAAGDVQQVRGE